MVFLFRTFRLNGDDNEEFGLVTRREDAYYLGMPVAAEGGGYELRLADSHDTAAMMPTQAKKMITNGSMG